MEEKCFVCGKLIKPTDMRTVRNKKPVHVWCANKLDLTNKFNAIKLEDKKNVH